MLANTTKITLADGIERQLRYTLGSFKRLKDKTGKSFLTGEAFAALDEELIPLIIFEGLTDKTNLTPEQVADLITTDCLKDVVEAMAQALSGGNAQSKKE